MLLCFPVCPNMDPHTAWPQVQAAAWLGGVRRSSPASSHQHIQHCVTVLLAHLPGLLLDTTPWQASSGIDNTQHSTAR